jgi:hypothetical protein
VRKAITDGPNCFLKNNNLTTNNPVVKGNEERILSGKLASI